MICPACHASAVALPEGLRSCACGARWYVGATTRDNLGSEADNADNGEASGGARTKVGDDRPDGSRLTVSNGDDPRRTPPGETP